MALQVQDVEAVDRPEFGFLDGVQPPLAAPQRVDVVAVGAGRGDVDADEFVPERPVGVQVRAAVGHLVVQVVRAAHRGRATAAGTAAARGSAARGAAVATARRAAARRTAAEVVAAAVVVTAAAVAPAPASAAFATAAEQGQFAAEALQDHLGGVLLLAALVGPFAGLQLALDIDRAALAQILLGDPGQVLVEDHHPVPLGAFALLAAAAVLPALGGGEREVHDLGAVLGASHLRVAAEVADQDDLVDAARHRLALACPSNAIAAPADAGRRSRRRTFPHRPAGSKPVASPRNLETDNGVTVGPGRCGSASNR